MPMIELLYKAITTIVLAGIATAAIMVVIKWLVDLGFAWSMVAICAGIVIWRYASSTEK